jgi:hypothetical protein
MPSEDFLKTRAEFLKATGRAHVFPLDRRLFDDNGERVQPQGGSLLNDPEWVARELATLDAETWPPKT